MTARKVTPIRKPAPVEHVSELPINVLDNALAQARATLDLIHSLATHPDGRVGLETLDHETLGMALHGAIERIDAASEAAKHLHSQARAAAESRP